MTEPLYYEDIEIGSTDTWGAYELTEAEIVEMATRFDPQPWHLDHDAAADSVFGGLVACACHLQCVLAALLNQDPRPMAIAAGLGSRETRYVAPGRLGAVLKVRRAILGKRESASRPDMGIVEIDNTLLDQDDRVVHTTEGAILVHRRPST